jgi:syntaxin 16
MEALHKQRISITFGNTQDKDAEIYSLSSQITEVIST